MNPGAGAARIGILGGTLDPIHVGHVQAARAACDALGFEEIIIMPVHVPPHRHEGPSASPYHRFAMAALAVNDEPRFVVSDEELSSNGPSYTALTLERLAARFGRSRLFFITGADAFADIESWYRYPEVLDLAHFVVVSRPGTPASRIPALLPGLAERMMPPAQAANAHSPSVFLVDGDTSDVSSTEIRRRLRTGESIAGMVPAPVERYIRRQRLYVTKAMADHVR